MFLTLLTLAKSRDITLPTKVRLVKAMVFPMVMYGCESWTVKKAEHWRIDTFELWCWRRLDSPLDCKEIKSVNPKGNQPWIFTGRTVADTEAPILGPPGVKSQLIGKDPDAGKDWGQEEKGATKDKMVRWHHWLIGHEFEQPSGDSEGQGSLACCSPWGCKESDMTERLNWTEPRPPCPSPTPGVHSDSRPSSQWCHPAISSSVVPFCSCPQSLPASESFPMSQLFAWGGRSTGVSALASYKVKSK